MKSESTGHSMLFPCTEKGQFWEEIGGEANPSRTAVSSNLREQVTVKDVHPQVLKFHDFPYPRAEMIKPE